MGGIMKYRALLLSFIFCFGALLIFPMRGSAGRIKLRDNEQPGQTTSKPSGFTMGFGFKFSGGVGYLLNGAGDLENLRQGRTALYEAYGREDDYSTSVNWEKLLFSPDFNVDFIVNIGRYFGIGFGTGFILASRKGEYSLYYDFIQQEGNFLFDIDQDYTRDYRITAIPVRTNLYLFLPVKNLAFFGYGGVGYYLGKLTNSYTYNDYYYYESPVGIPEWKHEEIYEWTADEESTCNTFGVQGGLGFEVKIAVISFGIEFFGRWVNFKDFEGTRSFSWEDQDRHWSDSQGWYSDTTTQDSGEFKGKLWIYDYLSTYLNTSYANMWIRDNEPSGSLFSNVRQAAVNLNAAGILFYLKIFFDLF